MSGPIVKLLKLLLQFPAIFFLCVADSLKMSLESLELYIPSILDEIRDWQNRKGVDSDCLIVLLHVQKEPLLVGELLVVVDSVVDLQRLIQVVVAFRFQVVDVLISFPGGPYEVGIGEVLRVCRRPPVPLLNLVFDDLIVIAPAYVVLLGELQQLFLVFQLLAFVDEGLLDFLLLLFGYGIQLLLFAPQDFPLDFVLQLALKLFLFLLLPLDEEGLLHRAPLLLLRHLALFSVH